MASRAQQDAFMDDSEETCPLCVEEFDLSDKSFKPCPCGYQICQFCYNNVRNNLNGLCPACRRTYDDENVEYRKVTPEEHKADAERQARKKALAKQKESEKKQVESLSRKHLVGKRVVQKDLVYVSGLNRSNVSEDELMTTMRNEDYFGKYGPIRKVVASKAREGPGGNNSIALYVTFERAEDAQRCIAAVNGSMNSGRTLRAQLGTTKYCSKYLRNELCTNPNCMFLHEIAEDSDSYTRQELSSLNAGSTQRSDQPSSTAPDPPQAQPIPQQVSHITSTAVQAMARQGSRDEAMSRSDSGDGSALPSTASWATKNSHVESRRSSKPASISASSPVVVNATTASKSSHPDAKVAPQAQLESQPLSQPAPVQTSDADQESLHQPTTNIQAPPLSDLDSRRPATLLQSHPFHTLLERLKNLEGFTFDRSRLSDDQLKEIDTMPPLYDPNAGLRMYRAQKRQEEERRKEEGNRDTPPRPLSTSGDDEEHRTGGSLQLGGEPEIKQNRSAVSGQGTSNISNNIQSPFSFAPGKDPLAPSFPTQETRGRFQFPQQSYPARPTSSLHQHQQSNPFQNSNPVITPGHTRQSSRYNFANDSTSSSTAINTPASSHLLFSQQAPSLNSNPAKQPQGQPGSQNQHFFSNVQGPPPGLKSSGTPPVSGGGMFGQGHGFASVMGGSLGFGQAVGSGKNVNDDLMRDILKGRGSGSSPGNNFGKRESTFPSHPMPPTASFPRNAPAPFLGPQAGSFPSFQDQALHKQKKKGRKHRHANTSSSGGSGLVDLADPSIMQARMHHGSIGQGQFGSGQESRIFPQGKEQSPATLPPIGSAPSAAKNADSKGSSFVPDGPRALAKPGSNVAASAKSHTKPAGPPPPTLPRPQDFPPLAAPSELSKLLSQKAPPIVTPIPSIKPAIPSLSKAPNRDAPPSKEATTAQTGQRQGLSHKVIPDTDKAIGSDDSISMITDPTSVSTKDDTLRSGKKDDERTPTIGNVPDHKNVPKRSSTHQQKQAPRTLDVGTTQVDSEVQGPSSTTTPGSSSKQKSVTPNSSQPATPAKSGQQSMPTSATKTQPRTLRLAEMPKVGPPAKAASPAITEPATLPSSAMSRRSSLVSAQAPGTPASERISDNVSMPSTALSRASSPGPAGKVGSGSHRQVSKNQRKKERQAQAKQIETEAKLGKTQEESVKEEKEEVVQAPIQGRKKKTKKVTAGGTTTTTPTATRPSSPVPKAVEDEEPEAPPTPALPSPVSKTPISTKANPPSVPEQAPAPSQKPSEESSNPLAQLLFPGTSGGSLPSNLTSTLFKSTSFTNRNFKFSADECRSRKPCPVDPALFPPSHKEAIMQGRPFIVDLRANKEKDKGPFVVLLPDGREIFESNQQLAERCVEIWNHLEDKDEGFLFTPDPGRLPGRAELERWIPKGKERDAMGVGALVPTTTAGGGSVGGGEEELPVIARWVASEMQGPSSSMGTSTQRQGTSPAALTSSGGIHAPSASQRQLHPHPPPTFNHDFTKFTSPTSHNIPFPANTPSSTTIASSLAALAAQDPFRSITTSSTTTTNPTTTTAAATKTTDPSAKAQTLATGPTATYSIDQHILYKGMNPVDLKQCIEDLEKGLERGRKEEGVLEKRLGGVVRRNKRLLGVV